jgi:hypothetical protein
MANDTDSFNTIKTIISTLESDAPEFMKYFSVAEQSDKDHEGTTVILKNYKKFRKDLNRNKYVVCFPSTLSINSFDIVKYFEGEGPRTRRPEYAVIIKANIVSSDINFIFVLGGFNDTNIRILKSDENTDDVEDTEDINASTKEVIDEAVNEALTD